MKKIRTISAFRDTKLNKRYASGFTYDISEDLYERVMKNIPESVELVEEPKEAPKSKSGSSKKAGE